MLAGGGYIFGSQVSAVGYQVSAVGYQVRVFRFRCGYGPEPVPGAEHLNLGPDGRDLGPENESPTADAMSSHPYLEALGTFPA
jgi:hypothetical protein